MTVYTYFPFVKMFTDFMLILMMALSCFAIYGIYEWNLPESTYVLTRYKVPYQGGEVEQTSLRRVK